jgi:hypothetical protein
MNLKKARAVHGLDKAWVGAGSVATSTTAAVAATATAATAATAVTTTTAAFTARGTFFARLCNVDPKIAALQILFIEHFNRFVGFFMGAHLNKGKTAGTAREFIKHQFAFYDRSGLFEQLLEVAFG